MTTRNEYNRNLIVCIHDTHLFFLQSQLFFQQQIQNAFCCNILYILFHNSFSYNLFNFLPTVRRYWLQHFFKTMSVSSLTGVCVFCLVMSFLVRNTLAFRRLFRIRTNIGCWKKAICSPDHHFFSLSFLLLFHLQHSANDTISLIVLYLSIVVKIPFLPFFCYQNYLTLLYLNFYYMNTPYFIALLFEKNLYF